MVKLTLQGSLPSATDIIPVSTAKNFLRVTHSGDDTLIGNLITAAVEVAQNYTNSRFLETEYNLTMETWTDVYVSNTYAQILTDGVETITGGYVGLDGLSQIVLPYAPLASVTHIKYYDSDNSQQTWHTSNYSTNTFINQKGFVEINNTVNTPSIYNRADAIEIRFKAGYGTDGDDVPESIKTAIMLILGFMYEKREDSVSRLPKASEYILDPYRFKTY
tara:strand:- start:3942 stop:4598 length:657 start_codon:yes stop_codon:yes gene_type:complete